VTLNPKDEFFILGCDGIWDCLTNEKCVEFVRERIDKMEPKAIGEEMLNTILSDDPRATQGIGGDNMTILIVDLQPASRGYKVEPAWGPLPKTEDLDITSATSALWANSCSNEDRPATSPETNALVRVTSSKQHQP